VPTLEALIGVPQPLSHGPITHTWRVQLVSATQSRERRPGNGELVQDAALRVESGKGVRMDRPEFHRFSEI
jgi:hypothetical protein